MESIEQRPRTSRVMFFVLTFLITHSCYATQDTPASLNRLSAATLEECLQWPADRAQRFTEAVEAIFHSFSEESDYTSKLEVLNEAAPVIVSTFSIGDRRDTEAQEFETYVLTQIERFMSDPFPTESERIELKAEFAHILITLSNCLTDSVPDMDTASVCLAIDALLREAQHILNNDFLLLRHTSYSDPLESREVLWGPQIQQWKRLWEGISLANSVAMTNQEISYYFARRCLPALFQGIPPPATISNSLITSFTRSMHQQSATVEEFRSNSTSEAKLLELYRTQLEEAEQINLVLSTILALGWGEP